MPKHIQYKNNNIATVMIIIVQIDKIIAVKSYILYRDQLYNIMNS